MNQKRALTVFLLSLFALSIIAAAFSLAPAKAETLNPQLAPSTDVGGSIGFFDLSGKIDLWLHGAESKDYKAIGELTKWLFLIIIVILSYSAIAEIGLPKSGPLQFVLAVIVSFLATFMITTQELITVLNSYTAFGVTIAVFFPILVLGFFTFVVSQKVSPIGIVLQKIMWVIYSVYLFLKVGVLLLVSRYYDATGSLLNQAEKVPVYLGIFIPDNRTEIATLYGQNAAQSHVMLYVLLFTAIAVFIIMVLGNKYVDEWLIREKRNAAITTAREEIELARASDALKAQEMKERGTKV